MIEVDLNKIRFIQNFDEAMNGFAEFIVKKVLLNDLDAVIVIGGMEGRGKSSAGQWLKDYIFRQLAKNEKLREKLIEKKYREGFFDENRYNYEKRVGPHYIISYEMGLDVYNRYVQPPPITSVIFMDEAFKDLLNRDAMKKVGKDMVKLVGQFRKFNYFWIVCFPNFSWLDPYFRNHRVEYYIHVWGIVDDETGIMKRFASFYYDTQDYRALTKLKFFIDSGKFRRYNSDDISFRIKPQFTVAMKRYGVTEETRQEWSVLMRKNFKILGELWIKRRKP
ncbi:hypothetical protein J7M00_03935 [bacterium]|nr:hypothetical protein [bacterium]